MEDAVVEDIKQAIKKAWPNAIKLETNVTWDSCCQD